MRPRKLKTTPAGRAVDRNNVEHELDEQESRARDMARRLIRLEATLGVVLPLKTIDVRERGST